MSSMYGRVVCIHTGLLAVIRSADISLSASAQPYTVLVDIEEKTALL